MKRPADAAHLPAPEWNVMWSEAAAEEVTNKRSVRSGTNA